MHVAIICGYGLFDPDIRSTQEIEGLTEYYGAVFSSIRQRGGIVQVVLCGGHTNPRRSQCSEARSVVDRIHDESTFFFLGPQRPILLEERSRNTVQNVFFALECLKRKGIGVTQVTFYCDTPRRWKVDVIAHAALRDERIPYEVMSYPRSDIHPNSKRWKQNLKALQYIFLPGRISAELSAPPAPPPSL